MEIVLLTKFHLREYITTLRGPTHCSSLFCVYLVLFVRRCSVTNFYKPEIIVEGTNIDHQNINEIKGEGDGMGKKKITERSSTECHLVLGAAGHNL